MGADRRGYSSERMMHHFRRKHIRSPLTLARRMGPIPKQIAKSAFAVAGLAFAWLGLNWLVAATSTEPARSQPLVRPVRYVTVSKTGGLRTRIFSGVARAGAESSLSFRVSGTVTDLATGVGDQLRAGSLIAELDRVDFELQVRETEAALRQAMAIARNSAAELRRARNLYENDNASRTDLDAAVAASESANAQVELIEKRLELAQRQVDYTSLVAPVDGDIASVLVEVNENVASGQPVVVLASGAAPEVDFVVPEGLIRQIHKSSPAWVVFDAIPSVRFPGVVTEVGVKATATGTMFPVTVRLDAEASHVRSGMAAEVAMEFGASDRLARFVLPSHAVAEDRDGRFVFVAERAADGLASVSRRPVTVGTFATGGIEIIAGLSDGEAVVTAGVSRLRDGDRVRLHLVE